MKGARSIPVDRPSDHHEGLNRQDRPLESVALKNGGTLHVLHYERHNFPHPSSYNPGFRIEHS
jgi:hypothetical protein